MVVTKQHNGQVPYWTVECELGLTWSTIRAMLDWCTEQFGPITHKAPERGQRKWTNFGNTFIFSHREDLAWFLLRWTE